MLLRNLKLFTSISEAISCLSKQTSKYYGASSTNSTAEASKQFRAAILHAGKDSLLVETLENPNKIDDNRVRISVNYCGINRADLKCLRDLEKLTPPFIPCTEFTGEIIELGPNCSQKLKIGDKVAVLSDDYYTGGGLSQQCNVSEDACIKIPKKISTLDAVKILRTYGNAILAFNHLAKLKPKQNVIVICGPDGGGLAAIEIAAKVHEANVFAIYESANVRALTRDDSVHRAINLQSGLTKVYSSLASAMKQSRALVVYDAHQSDLLHVVADFASAEAKFFTDNPFFDVDASEAPYFKKELSKKVATLCEFRSPIDWSRNVKKVNLAKLQHQERKLFKKTIDETFELFLDQKIKPFVSKMYSLTETNGAYRFIDMKKCLGNVIVDLQKQKHEVRLINKNL